MAKAYTQDEFDELMLKVQKVDMRVAEYLDEAGRDSCRMFQLDEIPCPHAWAVIKQKHLVVDNYYSDLFKPETVVKTYDIAVDPLPNEREWKIPKDILDEVVLPPRYKRPPGRLKKRRDKPLHELLAGKKRHACSTCGQLGHNRRSCGFEPRRK
ncbi:uncharacterized protein LOC132611735 [Lycium barbarum]|uniref:uncharacterized protein LOC132611735 n=1 Tax=Lycium barbarum TaxID=112863 RepID=UPI00293E9E27|nr:uncharacterized protein LOC132611735 [Lycium barbarum]